MAVVAPPVRAAKNAGLKPCATQVEEPLASPAKVSASPFRRALSETRQFTRPLELACAMLRRRRMRKLLTTSLLCLSAAGCGGSPDAPTTLDICDGFAPWETSAFVLPYAVNSAYFVSQGNCSPVQSDGGHRGVKKFGYDFDMPIGTPVLAARGGVVLQVEESHFDGQIAFTGLDNYVVITHDDGTADLYGHMTHDGVVVSIGDVVAAGQLIAYSGNTGNTANNPHLHFSVQTCDPVSRGTANCPTLPVTFRNADPNPTGLQVGRVYQAHPY